ncbi:type II toxin-antitoxin system YafO family toxin [Pseudomonas cannabina]|uniref:mRNA interferase YafO n=2 Tax=Pseudomonas syringae group TaxID=136849 RepID=A0A8T8BZY2_PSEYM|nr:MULTISPECIES: type II toxin-antitoxin system YafO family toxin [Pseudomonas syringae group]MBM0140170.1 type II toxin-antitoxin system YafO family toxin [Pseudomonas cannabina pv. alisalensis]QHE96829.1 mRNA interferase YafO [Pseudomonas syringae pv. maculicola str. ES4326]QQN20118.1 type II toxin-antitoxin system YafO family toxin [Pseudomonas cannabina pv. alisalensis]UBY97489.1 type II toxin-antitoxin system YafO family toxin [Pseudomonas cannabina pv. alisalensis]
MPSIVEYNPETYDELFKPIIASYPTLLGSLLADFAGYIDSGRLEAPLYFGCDVPYVKQHEAYVAGLMHIHLAIPPVVFPKNRPQADRKCPRNPSTDAALVYAQGLYYEDRYTLIALLYPSAHAKAADRKIILRLAAVAARFRDKY